MQKLIIQTKTVRTKSANKDTENFVDMEHNLDSKLKEHLNLSMHSKCIVKMKKSNIKV